MNILFIIVFRSFVLLAICSVVTSQQQQASDISDGISQFAYNFYKVNVNYK